MASTGRVEEGRVIGTDGRYLTLLPPINGADAISGSPYFTENPFFIEPQAATMSFAGKKDGLNPGRVEEGRVIGTDR